MSCGNAHEIPCTEILTAMLLVIDHEQANLEPAVLIHHLAECPPCQREYDVSALVKALITRACTKNVAPPAVRTRIHTEITQIQVEITRGFNH